MMIVVIALSLAPLTHHLFPFHSHFIYEIVVVFVMVVVEEEKEVEW